MNILYLVVLAIFGLSDAVWGVSVIVKNDQVYVDNKKVDLSKEQVIKETDLYKTYKLHSGESTITITKSKLGNAMSIKSVGPMTEEEKKKMAEMQQKIGKDVEKNIQQVQENINALNKQLNDRINKMNSELHKMMNFKFPNLF